MKDKIYIDVIIVSYAQTDELLKTTEQCINSLKNSEDQNAITFNIVILESEKSMSPYVYPGTVTIYPNTSFGYHKYLDIGVQSTKAAYLCLCNNDLLFHKGWATEILKPMNQYNDLHSASPYSSANHNKFGIKPNDGIKVGYRIQKEIAGWCIFIKRDILRLTGQLDPNYTFWYADNDYANTLFVLKLNHALVTSSFVDHLESKTLKKQSAERELQLTEGEITYFKKKWNHRLGIGWIAVDD